MTIALINTNYADYEYELSQIESNAERGVTELQSLWKCF
jgi:hypothetical protein